MDELKACPFCGGKATVIEFGSGHNGDGVFKASYKVGCEKCDIYFVRESRFTMGTGYPKFSVNGYDTAVDLWNRRAINIRQSGSFDD